MTGAIVPAEGPEVRHLLSLAVDDPSPGSIERLLERYAERGTWHLYAYMREGEPVGCIGVALEQPGEAVLQHVAVALESRRRGIARAMIAGVVERHLLERLESETDWASAYFYRACGFRVWSMGAADAAEGEVERYRCVWTRGSA